MFFIMGSGQKQKQLAFDQTVICKCCGKYGHIQVFMVYSYLSFFFLPLFKWNRRYYVKMSCCGSTCEINSELGKEIERGHIRSLNMDSLSFQSQHTAGKQCRNCGFYTEEDFDYCPKCGVKF